MPPKLRTRCSDAAAVSGLRQSVELDDNPLDLVFPNLAGKPLASQNLAKRIFEPALRAAGLRKVTFPSTRFISRQVGHSSAKLTLDVYAHLMEGAQEEAMARLEERLCF